MTISKSLSSKKTAQKTPTDKSTAPTRDLRLEPWSGAGVHRLGPVGWPPGFEKFSGTTAPRTRLHVVSGGSASRGQGAETARPRKPEMPPAVGEPESSGFEPCDEAPWLPEPVSSSSEEGRRAVRGGPGRGQAGVWPHLLEAVVLLTVRAVPAVAVPVGHHRVLAAEPAVDRGVCWLRPVDKERGEAAGACHRAAGDQAGWARPCLDVPRPLGGPARGPRWLRLLSPPAKLPAQAGERLESHQIPWLLHAQEATPGHLLSWGSGMGAPGAQAGQGPGSGTAPRPHEASSQAAEWCSWGACRWKERPVLHKRPRG